MLPEVIKGVRATNRQIPSSGFFPPELTTRLWNLFGLLGDVTFLSRFPRTSWLETNTETRFQWPFPKWVTDGPS